MSSEIAIHVDSVSKCFQIYDKPRDRLMQMLVRGRRQYFREFWALKNVSFEIRKGETVGVIGRNGSGKSTLLQIICGTLSPTSGEVQTSGRIAALLELGSGFNPEFTGRENVYLNGAVLGLSKEEIDARYDSIVAFSEIGDFVDQPVKTYSSGMLVRLAFSVAINADPEILIVDEALSVGDELFQRKCFSRIEAIRAGGATILFVSHSGAQIIELCDRAILLDGGERLAVGQPKQTVGRYQRLLYAPQHRQAEIREEIRGMDLGGGVQSDDAGAVIDPRAHGASDVSASLEAFDPHLKPTSTVEYEARAARIEAPEINTVSGERVNNLVRGASYIYRYKVVFTESAENVRFGMLIKTKSGIELGGAVSAHSIADGVPFVSAGDRYTVEFRFKCALMPGVFFLNAGVVGTVGGCETFLHRLLDVAMFRVVDDVTCLATGIVDFECQPHFRVLGAEPVLD